MLFWVVVAVAAPWLAPYSPTRSYLPMQHPLAHARDGGTFWLGTDHLGRDLLSRLIFGTRTVLFYAPLATACAYLGWASAPAWPQGYRRGWLDELLSRASDLVLAFPALVLYIAIIGRFGASGLNIVLAVVLATSPGVMRIVRGVVLEERGRAYVAAARMRGERALFIGVVEILPNVRGPPGGRSVHPARLRHHHHRHARLPRPGPAAAHARLGRHDQRDAAISPWCSHTW